MLVKLEVAKRRGANVPSQENFSKKFHFKPMTYKDDIEQLREAYPYVGTAFGGMRMLEDVFKWIREVGSAAGSIDVIAQDEFSHDFVLELPELKRFAAFGVT